MPQYAPNFAEIFSFLCFGQRSLVGAERGFERTSSGVGRMTSWATSA